MQGLQKTPEPLLNQVICISPDLTVPTVTQYLAAISDRARRDI
jgi:hypothetical protein